MPSNQTQKGPANDEKEYSKCKQTTSDSVEPCQVSSLLSGYSGVHTPETGYNVHGQDNRTKHRQCAKYVVGAFSSFVHSDVDLGKVVGVSARQETIFGQ
jgi:hypothetical protein